jgi:hypothetical protein
MSAFATTWLRSDRSVANVRSMERPAERNWSHRGIWLDLLFMLLGQFLPFTTFNADAQNLGTQPAFGQAVHGRQAMTVEGTALNIVNWSCNVIASVIDVACLDVAAWHYKGSRGFGGWLARGIDLMVISGLGRMAEGFITQAQGIQ